MRLDVSVRVVSRGCLRPRASAIKPAEADRSAPVDAGSAVDFSTGPSKALDSLTPFVEPYQGTPTGLLSGSDAVVTPHMDDEKA